MLCCFVDVPSCEYGAFKVTPLAATRLNSPHLLNIGERFVPLGAIVLCFWEMCLSLCVHGIGVMCECLSCLLPMYVYDELGGPSS